MFALRVATIAEVADVSVQVDGGVQVRVQVTFTSRSTPM